MRYRTKLYIAALSVSIVSSCLALVIVEGLTRRYLFKFLQINVASVAGTTAVAINGDLLKEIRVAADQEKPAFAQIQTLLRKARDINRGKDIYIKFLYTTYRDPKDPKKFLFAVDSEENPRDFSPPGTEDPATTQRLLFDRLGDTFASDKAITDPWGTWITGYSPVYDSQGNYVATVGADISAELVEKNLNHLLFFALIAFVLSVLEATIVVVFHANKVTRALRLLEEATKEVRKSNYTYRIYLDSNDEFQDLASMVNSMNQWLEENEKIKRGFTHFVSQNVLQKLIDEHGTAKLGGQKRKITVLYSNLRNFHPFAERLSPEDVLEFLNEYFKRMLEVIFRYNGMLDKLLGEGMIAEFGMPLEDPEQEKNAILAALEIQKAIDSLRKTWERRSAIRLNFGIGIHTGETIVGTIDTENRMQYASIGDTINIAEQIESSEKSQNYPLTVSESTYKAVEKEFDYKELGPISLTESGQTIQIYAILSERKNSIRDN